MNQLYLINASLAMILHWRNIAFIGDVTTWSAMYKVIGEHSAMSSIGWDIVCCTVIEGLAAGRVENVVLSPVFSLGGVAGMSRGLGL